MVPKWKVLYNELKEFAPELVLRTRIILGTKTDLDTNNEKLDELKQSLADETVLGISVYAREGFKSIENAFLAIIGD